MQAADYPEVPDDFGHWLAGFIDGEGCFQIAENLRRPARLATYTGYQPKFNLALRADDASLLRRIREATGIGHVHRRKTYKLTGRAAPQAVWDVLAKEQCVRLTELLDHYPLRSRKANDYALWREAVGLWAAMERRSTRKGGIRFDWERIAALRAQLMASRAFQKPGGAAKERGARRGPGRPIPEA